jgi:hypothetical protein
VFSPTRVPSDPATAGGFPKLAAAGSFLKRTRKDVLKRWLVRLVVAAAAIVVLWLLFLVAVRIITTDLWFDSVHAGSVYQTMLRSQVVLFSVFGIIAGLIGGATLLTLCRMRAPLSFSPDDDTFRWTFRRYERRVRPLFLLLAVIIPGILVGQQAAGRWQTYLLWHDASPWHQTDPHFHKDISFFVDVNPFHLMVVALLLQALSYAFWIAAIGGYWYGAWRLRRGRRKVTKEFVRLVSLLLVGYLICTAASDWMSRYAVDTSQRGPVTGPSYTDIHAALPSKYVLMAVAIAGAAAVLAIALFGGRVRTLVGVCALLVVITAVVGSAWPSLVYQFRESPSAAKLDLGEIARNQTATLAAFGLNRDVTTIPFSRSTTVPSAALPQLADKVAQTPIIDPNQLSPTFNVKQQIEAYYGFKSTLDIGNYNINGRRQDVALAVRELQSSAIPHSGWVNNHLVYTHGYGIVAAPTDRVDPRTESPVFLDGGMPPEQQIPVTRPQVYFGQAFGTSSYSIVGQPVGSTEKLEFDHPGGGSSNSVRTTYQGGGGIPIGSTLRRLMFAVQLHDPNILFSSELNSASQLLMVRNPRARVAKIAPWLTLDGDVYPAVVNGQIQWIVDGYTTSSNYPNSQLINLHSATSTTLTANGASVVQPNSQVNYMQNSVKAVVDAYTGKVTLYEWNQKQHPDPLLKAWESAFPGLVKPQASIPSALTSQLRYPTDLFNVQRTLLARYHVSQPAGFYSGNDFWTTPNDPTVGGSSSTGPSLPARYISMSATGFGSPQYSLTSPMVTLNGRQLTAFVYVNARPGPDYGKFTVLSFPSAAGGESPLQVQNDIESDTNITEALTLQRGGNSRVILGGLVAIPVAGQLLYVEPVYTQSTGSASFPILRHVIALYANGNPSFENTLKAAVDQALKSGAGTG